MRAAPTFPAGMWISLFITIFTINGIQASATPEFGVMHQFTAYDCERPLSVEALQLPSHCLDHKTDDNTDNLQTNLTMTDNKPYRLLQKATYHEFDAYVCTQSSIDVGQLSDRYTREILCTGNPDPAVPHRIFQNGDSPGRRTNRLHPGNSAGRAHHWGQRILPPVTGKT